MQLIKYLLIISLFLGSIFLVYSQTKSSYLSRGISDGALNAKIDIFNKLKPHMEKCILGDFDSGQELLKVKTLEVYIKINKDLCYRE